MYHNCIKRIGDCRACENHTLVGSQIDRLPVGCRGKRCPDLAECVAD